MMLLRHLSFFVLFGAHNMTLDLLVTDEEEEQQGLCGYCQFVNVTQ